MTNVSFLLLSSRLLPSCATFPVSPSQSASFSACLVCYSSFCCIPLFANCSDKEWVAIPEEKKQAIRMFFWLDQFCVPTVTITYTLGLIIQAICMCTRAHEAQ